MLVHFCSASRLCAPTYSRSSRVKQRESFLICQRRENRSFPRVLVGVSYCPFLFLFVSSKVLLNAREIVKRSGDSLTAVVSSKVSPWPKIAARARRKKWLARRKIWRTCGPFKGPIGARRAGRRSRRSKGALSVLAPFLARYTLEGVRS